MIFQSQSVLRCLGLSLMVLGLLSPGRTTSQEKSPRSTDIRCELRVEHSHWNRTEPAIVSGSIENLSDGPMKIAVVPTLYLSSRQTSEKYWAPVDLLNDRSLPTNIGKSDGGSAIIGGEPAPIKLIFTKAGEKIAFRFDAQHVLWGNVISSVWPSTSLFTAVKPQDYDLRMVLETDDGHADSQAVKVSIDSRHAQ